MTDDAENMGLMPLLIDGVAHGFAVDGKTFVFLSIGFIPTLQGSVELYWIDANQDITDVVSFQFSGQNKFTLPILFFPVDILQHFRIDSFR